MKTGRVNPTIYKATEDYRRGIAAFTDAKGISWTAFDFFYKGNGWPMPLFDNREHFIPTISGTFFKEEL